MADEKKKDAKKGKTVDASKRGNFVLAKDTKHMGKKGTKVTLSPILAERFKKRGIIE